MNKEIIWISIFNHASILALLDILNYYFETCILDLMNNSPFNREDKASVAVSILNVFYALNSSSMQPWTLDGARELHMRSD